MNAETKSRVFLYSVLHICLIVTFLSFAARG
jgi:hypothetical protein